MIDKIVAGMCVEQKIIQASWPQPDSRVGAVRGRFSRKLPMALTAELVERCERPEPDRGPDPNFTSITEQEREALIEQLVRELHAGPLWVFAYGSLIWKPIFISIEHFPATAYGWHRSFCLELRDLRGSPQQPGLMMALDRGGCCKGIVYRLSDANPRQQIGQLVHRELNSREGLHSVRWITAQAGSERIRALTFWAGPRGKAIYRNLPLGSVARTIARACGPSGSCAAYLFWTVSTLDEFGIRDRNLWRLQQLVADEIMSAIFVVDCGERQVVFPDPK